MANALRELLAVFGVEVDEAGLERGKEKVEGLKESLEKAGEALKAFVAYETIKEIGEFVEGTIESVDALTGMAAQLGVSTDEIQGFQLAATSAGVSVDSLTSAMRVLNRNLVSASEGDDVAVKFAKLGISVREAGGEIRPASDVMAEFADKIRETRNPADRLALATAVLGKNGAALIPLLAKGGEAFAEAREQVAALGGGLGEEFVEQAEKAHEETVKLSFAWTGLRATLVQAILPAFVLLVDGLKKLTVGAIAFEKKSHVLEDAFKIGTFAVVVAGLAKIVTALRAVTSAQVLAWVTNPVFLFAAAVAVAILVYNDLKTALAGGKSLFGEYFGQTGIDDLRKGLVYAADASDILYSSLETVGNVILAMVDGMSAFVGLFTQVGASGDIANIKKDFADIESSWALTGKRAIARHDATTQTVDDQGNVVEGPGAARQPVAFARQPAPGAPAATRSPSSFERAPAVTQSITNNVTVHTTSDDPKGIAKAAGMGVASAQEKSTNNALNAVRSQ